MCVCAWLLVCCLEVTVTVLPKWYVSISCASFVSLCRVAELFFAVDETDRGVINKVCAGNMTLRLRVELWNFRCLGEWGREGDRYT